MQETAGAPGRSHSPRRFALFARTDRRTRASRRPLAVFDAYLSAFFGKHLSGESSALLEGPAQAYPEITITKK